MAKKIKNPEKFILHLRKTIQRKDEWIEFLQNKIKRIEGIEIIYWTPYEASQSASSSLSLLGFKPGDKMAIIGEVFDVHASKCKDGNQESSIKYMVKETRKLES